MAYIAEVLERPFFALGEDRPVIPAGGQTTLPPTGAGTIQLPPAQPIPTTPPGMSPGGGAPIAGLRLFFVGLNFGLNWLNDRRQQQRVQAELRRIEPVVQRERRSRPDHGILLAIHYHQLQLVGSQRESLLRPGPVFSHIVWATGRTRDEAWQNMATRSPEIRPAPPPNHQAQVSLTWIPPLRPANVLALRTPFPQVGFGTFAVQAAVLQDVNWGGRTGFDDEGQTRLRPSQTPKFILLEPPSAIEWLHGQQTRRTSIPIVQRRTSIGRETVKAVNMDPVLPGNVTAVPIFPYDPYTDRLFQSAPKTHDTLNQLRGYQNIDKMRWVRPENILKLRGFS